MRILKREKKIKINSKQTKTLERNQLRVWLVQPIKMQKRCCMLQNKQCVFINLYNKAIGKVVHDSYIKNNIWYINFIFIHNNRSYLIIYIYIFIFNLYFIFKMLFFFKLKYFNLIYFLFLKSKIIFGS